MNRYICLYISRRVGTPGDRMENQIPEEVKHKRFDKLKALVESQIEENNQRVCRNKTKILVEGESKNNPEMLTGRTDSNKVVIFKGPKCLINNIIEIEIEVRTYVVFKKEKMILVILGTDKNHIS